MSFEPSGITIIGLCERVPAPRLLFSTLGLLLTACLAMGQTAPNSAEVSTHEETPTFRTATNVVLVPVVVRDYKGQSVGGLTRQEFQLFDRGKPQAISSFAVEKSETSSVVPVPTVKTPGVEVRVTEPPSAPVPPSRFVAYLFDDVHVGTNDLVMARDAADRHMRKLADPKLRAAIFTTSGQTMLDFTDDRAQWHKALFLLQPRPIARPVRAECPDLTYEWADLIRNHNDAEALFYAEVASCTCSSAGQCNPNAGYNPNAPVPDSAGIRAVIARVIAQHEQESHVALDVLRNLVKRIAVMPGQRTIVLASPGFMTEIGSRDEETTIIDRAIRANVVINTLDVRGLATETPDISKSPGLGGPALAYVEGMQHLDFVAQSDVLAEVANGTGGTFFHNNNDLDTGFDRVAGTPEYRYILGFTPDSLKADGSIHGLKVILPNNPHHYDLEARHNYTAPNPITDPAEVEKEQIRVALFSRDEVNEFPVELHTEYFKTSSQNARLSLVAHIDIKPLKFRKEAGRNQDELTVVAGLFDHNGNYIAGAQKSVTLRLLDANLERWQRNGITVPASFEVKPGAYLLRLVVRDRGGELMAAKNGVVEIE